MHSWTPVICMLAAVAIGHADECTTDGIFNEPGTMYSTIKLYLNRTTSCEETCLAQSGVALCPLNIYLLGTGLANKTCQDRGYSNLLGTQDQSTICSAETVKQFYYLYSSTNRSAVVSTGAALVEPFETALPVVGDAPHMCSLAQPQAVYKVDDDQWCETFCLPGSLVSIAEQFGDVNNGTCSSNWCVDHSTCSFDHSLSVEMYGANVTVDMYKSTSK